jgi:hypothetical protein
MGVSSMGSNVTTCHLGGWTANTPHVQAFDRFPEAERTVGNLELRSKGQPAPLQIQEQPSPGLGAFATR